MNTLLNKIKELQLKTRRDLNINSELLAVERDLDDIALLTIEKRELTRLNNELLILLKSDKGLIK